MRSANPRRRRLALAGVLYALALMAGAGIAGHAASRAGEWSLAPESVRFERGHFPDELDRSFPSGVDARLSYVAGALAGVGVAVTCWSRPGWKRQTRELVREFGGEQLGPWRAYTTGDRLAIHLSPEVCAQLRRLTGDASPIGPADSSDALAWSVYTLSHEAQHASGVEDESQADCLGMQAIGRASRLLGRTAAEGRYLATVYWKHWQVWLAPRYRSSECRNGGRFDVHPNAGFWP